MSDVGDEREDHIESPEGLAVHALVNSESRYHADHDAEEYKPDVHHEWQCQSDKKVAVAFHCNSL